MATTTFKVPNPLNASCQEGDIAYYIKANTSLAGFTTHNASQQVVKIGKIKQIVNAVSTTTGVSLLVGEATITCDIGSSTTPPALGDFILFSKDRSVNESSILGYYSKFSLINNSKDKAELFNIACEMSESSK